MGAGDPTDEDAGDSAEDKELGGTQSDDAACQDRKRILSQSSQTEDGDQKRQKSGTFTRTVTVDAFLEMSPEEMKPALADEEAQVTALEFEIGAAQLQAKEANDRVQVGKLRSEAVLKGMIRMLFVEKQWRKGTKVEKVEVEKRWPRRCYTSRGWIPWQIRRRWNIADGSQRQSTSQLFEFVSCQSIVLCSSSRLPQTRHPCHRRRPGRNR